MNIEVRIYNPDLELQGIIDEFSSLIWIRRYQQPGEFELRTPYAEVSKELLVKENVIQRYDGSTPLEAGVIENILMNKDEIVVKGRFLESYLDRRLIKETEEKEAVTYDGNAETSMRDIISNMVAFPLLELGERCGSDEELEFQATYKSVLSIIEKVCKATTLGFRIRPDFSNQALYFEVYQGTDRTADTAAKVIFSEKYDNLLNEEYTYDSTNLKSKVFVTQVINDTRVTYTVGSGSGRNLREYHYAASVDTNGKTTTQIRAAMRRQGNMALEARTESETFVFTTDPEAPFIYREDYDIGDLIHINHITWGISMSRRITEIEEDFEEGGREVILVCGSPLPEIIDFEEG